MKFSVYILYARGFDRYYIGQTQNVEKRLSRHNRGVNKSTKAYIPWELVYQEKYETRSDAMAREKHLKLMKSKIYLKELISMNKK